MGSTRQEDRTGRTPEKEKDMTEQKYRAVVRTADGRQMYGTLTGIESTPEEITATFTEERIQRPVPTTCTCPPPATHMEDGPDQDCPKHGDRVILPLVHIVSPRASGKRSALLDAVLDRADERGIQVQVVPSPHPPTREQILDAVTSGNPYGAADFEQEIADRVLVLIQNGADR